MPFTDSLLIEAIDIDLNAKPANLVLESLVGLAAQAHGLSQPHQIVSALIEREELSTTGIGGGIAVPHCKTAQADRLVDRIDPDSEVHFPGGAEDLNYLQSIPPHLTANRPLADITELKLFLQLEDDSYNRLIQKTTALPQNTTININTAPPEVLLATIPELGGNEAETLVNQLSHQGFASREEMLDHPLLKGRINTNAMVDVVSRFFLIEAHAEHGDAEVHLYTMLQRDNAGRVSIISRKLVPDADLALPAFTAEN